MTTSIYPCLWFDDGASKAARLYTSLFNNSGMLSENPVVSSFHLGGTKFIGINGGPMYHPNSSISFYTLCESEEEFDRAWNALSLDGKVLMEAGSYPWSKRYGWLEDRYGVNWQLSLDKWENVGQKCSPVLMYTGANAGKAEAAIEFYLSLFPESALRGIARYQEGQGDVVGTIAHAQFNISGFVMMAMDSSHSHNFHFTEGISIVVECDTQQTIDYYWNALTKEGEESMCGWLKDKYGVSWQIIPSNLGTLMSDPDRGQRVSAVLFTMRKLDMAALENA